MLRNRKSGSLRMRAPALLAGLLITSLVGAFPAAADGPDRFEPAAVTATLGPGQSTTIQKTLHLDALPGAADIIIAVDTTGSMGPAIAQAQLESNEIFTDVTTAIPGARFAVVDLEDYPGQPGGLVGRDQAYTLLTPGYTATAGVFQAAIATMAALSDEGGDFPEAFNRTFFEAYSDATLLAARNAAAVRFLVVLGDAAPHSATAFGNCPAAPPADLGRDEAPGGGDDLNTTATIAGLNADDTTLFMIHYQHFNTSTTLACYDSLAAATGGDAVSGGGASNLSQLIIDGIRAASASIDEVQLVVSGSGCQTPAGLNITFSPPNPPPYGPFTAPVDIQFQETITVPASLLAGTYSCTVTAVVDGVQRATQAITVAVTTGPPATLTLEPETDINTVDSQHCVTATVKDALGQATASVTVRFSVSGSVTTSGTGTSPTDANGQATFCYTGPTTPGVDAITAYADTNNSNTPDAGEPSGAAAKTWVSGPPATLVLTPPAATNPVGSQHCVTATVRDAFGNPTPGITVNFTVTGSVNTTGSATTNASGQATFCYVGPELPGADAITAYADTDLDNTQDPGEPAGTAAKTWVLPGTTADCKVTGGGRITANNGDKATFGGNAHSKGPKGNEEYTDHGPATPMKVKSINVQAVVCSADHTQASIYGEATVNGTTTVNYLIQVKDLGEPGRQDTYRILLSNGYDSGVNTLESGNIQIRIG